MIMDVETAMTALAAPRLNPKMFAVYIITSILMAGPEYKKVVAGPIPAPRLNILSRNPWK